MRVRNKKIVLVESISNYQSAKDSEFIEHQDQPVPMKTYRREVEEEDSLAEIFYEALLNQSIANRQKKVGIKSNRIVSITPFSTDYSEKRPNSGKIVRRSLSVNHSPSKSPEMQLKPLASTQLRKYQSFSSSTQSRVQRKQNVKKVGKDMSKSKSVGKKQIRYKVKLVRC